MASVNQMKLNSLYYARSEEESLLLINKYKIHLWLPLWMWSVHFYLQGLDSGFAGGSDDMYNVYDKPWRAGGGLADKIYRPSKGMDKDIYGDDVEKLIQTSK